MGKFKDLTGQKFGRLTVIERAENKGKQTYWLCYCDCSNKTVVRADCLQNGTSQSCGCLQRENANGHTPTHGMCRTIIYVKYTSMKNRCFNKNAENYPRYGGRGITVYPDWIHNFKAFYDYVSNIEHFGEEGYTLDRIDVNGNYEPNNLRWATAKTQSRNTRKNLFVEYNGEKISLIEAS